MHRPARCLFNLGNIQIAILELNYNSSWFIEYKFAFHSAVGEEEGDFILLLLI